MNNGPMLYFGLFASMAISWVTFVLGPLAQLGNLQPARTVAALPVDYPNSPPGLAAQGAEVYRAFGCAYCHTQQVRPAESGPDLARGWGIRRSVAHDYIFDRTVMPGSQRLGPDLANAGLRMDAMAVLARLWDPRIVNNLDSAHSMMPSYKYLFDVRKIGRAPSANALPVPPGFAPPAGYEIVPRPAARALAAYVAGLRQDQYLFEAPPPPGAATTNAPPGGTNAQPNRSNATNGTNGNNGANGTNAPALPGGTNAANPQSWTVPGGTPALPNPQSAIRNPQSTHDS